MFMTDELGKRVLVNVSFRKVESPFGFLQLVSAEKNGIEVPKKLFDLQKNSLLHRWSQIMDILSIINSHEPSASDKLRKLIAECNEISELIDTPTFQFLQEQLQLLTYSLHGRRYSKHILILAAELICISPAAYRFLRNSKSVILPNEKLIRDLMNKSLQNANLQTLLEKLEPQQRLISILFDEVKLKKALRFSDSHIIGYSSNEDNHNELATSALVIEIVCHHGGPRFVLSINPVSKLNSEQLSSLLRESISVVIEKGGRPLVLICDNCPLNQGTYRLLGGPGHVVLPDGLKIFLIYDYPHIFKNVRNNWITEAQKLLSFTVAGVNMIASWSDIVKLYEEDRKRPIRLTKLTYNSVHPKPLQRQSIPLVYQVFNEKTVAALKALRSSLSPNEGTIFFVQMISEWFRMMNVKDKFQHHRLLDDFRTPWRTDCETFSRLKIVCNIISTCRWEGSGQREKKLTKFTASAFTVTTHTAVSIANFLFDEHNFSYLLPGAVLSTNPLKKFFGQARQRVGGNFYIDVLDVTAAAKVQRLHQLVKRDIIPVDGQSFNSCEMCAADISDDDVDLINEVSLSTTQSLLDDDSDSLKHSIVYIAGFLTRKHLRFVETEEVLSSEFLDELNRGGLSMPTLATVNFVHCAMTLHESLPKSRKNCVKYFSRLLSFIDCPIAKIDKACQTLSNTLFKGFVLHNSDRESSLGCLRRREKLTTEK